MKHSFTSSKPDTGDGSVVRPSNWNDTHVIGWTTLSLSPTTLSYSNHDGVLVTTGASNFVLNVPSAAGRSGRTFFVKKVDSGAGAVVLTPLEPIDGIATYSLVNQGQYVEIASDGVAWQIVRNN